MGLEARNYLHLGITFQINSTGRCQLFQENLAIKFIVYSQSALFLKDCPANRDLRCSIFTGGTLRVTQRFALDSAQNRQENVYRRYPADVSAVTFFTDQLKEIFCISPVYDSHQLLILLGHPRPAGDIQLAAVTENRAHVGQVCSSYDNSFILV